MALSNTDLQSIGDYVKENLAMWLTESKFSLPDLPQSFLYNDRLVRIEERSVALLERMVRVEEETKHLRQDMLEGFVRMDKRFEQVDKHFADMTKRIDRFMIWSFALTLTVGGLIIGVLKLIL